MAELEYFIDPEAKFDLTNILQNDTPLNLIPDPDGPQKGPLSSDMKSALDTGIVRHPIVGHFMLETHQLMIRLGIDPERMRFRQHEQDEMEFGSE